MNKIDWSDPLNEKKQRRAITPKVLTRRSALEQRALDALDDDEREELVSLRAMVDGPPKPPRYKYEGAIDSVESLDGLALVGWNRRFPDGIPRRLIGGIEFSLAVLSCVPLDEARAFVAANPEAAMIVDDHRWDFLKVAAALGVRVFAERVIVEEHNGQLVETSVSDGRVVCQHFLADIDPRLLWRWARTEREKAIAVHPHEQLHARPDEVPASELEKAMLNAIRRSGMTIGECEAWWRSRLPPPPERMTIAEVKAARDAAMPAPGRPPSAQQTLSELRQLVGRLATAAEEIAGREPEVVVADDPAF